MATKTSTTKRRKLSITAIIVKELGGTEYREFQFDEYDKRKIRGEKLDWYKNR